MKKLLMAALAAATLTVSAVPAQAQSFGISLSFGDNDRRYDNRRDVRRAERDYARDMYQRHFRSQRSYYRNRCYKNEVVVRDPWTNRMVCMTRKDYRDFVRDQRRYRF